MDISKYNDLKFIKLGDFNEGKLRDGKQGFTEAMYELLYNKIAKEKCQYFEQKLLSVLKTKKIAHAYNAFDITPDQLYQLFGLWSMRMGEVTWNDLIEALEKPQFDGLHTSYINDLKDKLKERDIELEAEIDGSEFMELVSKEIDITNADEVKKLGVALGLKLNEVKRIVATVGVDNKASDSVVFDLVSIFCQKFPEANFFNILNGMNAAEMSQKDIKAFAEFWKEEDRHRLELQDTSKPTLPVTLQKVEYKQIDHLVKSAYTMCKKPRGRAVIINNKQFSNDEENKKLREGSEVDVANLRNLFEALGFIVDLHENCPADEIRDIILDESYNDDAHRDADAFILVLMSHGTQGRVQGSDGRDISIVSDVMDPFDGSRCPLLIKKPKIFIIQACQGDGKTHGFSAPSGRSQTDGGEGSTTKADGPGGSATDSAASQEPLPVQQKADTLLAKSTVDGFQAWRDTELGSWYIRALVRKFYEQAHREHLQDMLTSIADDLTKLQTSGEQKFVQISKFDSTLTKKLYFFPGYNAQ